MKPLSLILILMTAACAPAPEQSPPSPPSTSAVSTTETSADETSWPSPLATPPPERSEIRQLHPVDEAVRDREFAQFRDDLLIATRSRDHRALLEAINPSIRTSFGADGGIEQFKTMWKPEDPKSKLWSELEHVLTLGGTFREPGNAASFCAPYPYSAWPEDLDAFEYLVVTRAGTPLKASLEPSSTDVTSLGYEFVRIAEKDPVRGGNAESVWRRVETADGREGFVDASHVRSPIDYRACFSRHPEGWRMDLFVAGD